MSSVSPERRANLRHLRAEFEAAFDAMGDDRDPASPAFRAADARYRAWIGGLDAVALALLDDIDACEASARDQPTVTERAFASAGAGRASADVDQLFSGLDDLRRSVDLIGTPPPQHPVPRKPSARTRAMSVVGQDRVARHWTLSPGDGLGPHRWQSFGSHPATGDI